MRVQRRTPPPGSRSCTVPARRAARHWGPMAAGAARGHTATHRFVPAAVDRRPRRRARPPETVSPPGVVQSRLQTSRAGRWRNGGLADYQTGRGFIEKHRPACVSREAQARGSARTPASRAALTFRRRSYPQNPGAECAAGRRVCVRNWMMEMSDVRAANSAFPLPASAG